MISILMPLYNGIEFLEESLLSVVQQKYKKWEIIIGINGYSKDSEIEKKALETVKDIKMVFPNIDVSVNHYETIGKPNTLNNMVSDAKYDYIALLDVDDKWAPDKLEKQVLFLHLYDVIGTGCKYIGDYNFMPKIPYGHYEKEHDFFSYNPIINSSVIMHKKHCHWENIDLEDYDLWFRLYFNNCTFYNLNDCLCYHRIHQASAFNNSNNRYVDDLKNKWRKYRESL